MRGSQGEPAFSPARYLDEAGWQRDGVQGIWRHPEAASIAYSDGDAAEEAVLAAIVAAHDRSIASSELPPLGADWPLEYHLSGARANLVRPLPIRRGSRVLELGAGCGAITRALGETGANVVALEGSERRATAAAARCHELENVAIACGDARQATLPGTFDWVVVVGVLEYVRKGATATPDPELAFLERTCNWLASEGVLVLAIENRLGMKYLAGCGEDHVGHPFFGVEDRYASSGPATFGRAELTKLLERAGYRSHEFLFPFPDYKLPEVILRSENVLNGSIDAAALAAGTFSRDYSGARTRAFSESLAWRAAGRNGLIADLANSFLVIATPATRLAPEKSPDDANVLAWAFASQRRPAHRVETRFLRTANGITVEKRPLHGGDHATADPDAAFTRRDLAEPYLSGELLHEAIARALARREDTAIVDGLVDSWLDALVQKGKLADGPDAARILLPSDYLDAIPSNAMLTRDGGVRFFDLEWVAKRPVALAWIVLRGLLGLVRRLDDVGHWEGRTVLHLAVSALARHGLTLGDDAVRMAASEDERLVREVHSAGDAFPFPLTEASLSAPIAPRVELLADALQRGAAQLATVQREVVELRRATDAMWDENKELRRIWRDEQRRHADAIGQIHESEAKAHERGIQLQKAHSQVVSLGSALAELRERSAHEAREAEQGMRGLRDELEARTRELESARDETAALQDLFDARGQEVALARARIDAQLVELTYLQNERATFGGKLGRFVTRQRNRWLPVESRRGRAVTLAARFVESLVTEGTMPALRRTAGFAGRTIGPRAPSSGSAPAADVAAIGDGRTASPAELAQWIAATEPDPAELDTQRRDAATWSYRPLLSVIVPVYRVPSTILDAMLESLRRQTYERWEACIACADGPDSENWQLLSRRSDADVRLRPFLLDKNLGISGNSNAALAAATGEFVALLDHDDELAPSAFFDVVKALNSERELDFIYTDKDSIDATGQHRQHALFKPSWSPEILYSVNYLTHLNVIRRSLIETVGGWRTETDGAQDWDLFFRLTERTTRIARVAGLHYHWRIIPTSTATGLTAKPYAAMAQLRCQRDRLQRLAWPATAVVHEESGFRVIWSPPPSPNVELVVHARGAEQLRECLDTLRFAELSDVATIRVLATRETPDYAAIVRDFGTVWGARVQFERGSQPLSARLTEIARGAGPAIVVLVDARVRFLSTPAIEEVARWVNGADYIAWAAGIALGRGDIVREAGRVANADGISAPLFRDVPLRSWGWFGGALWHRNASAASPTLFALRREDLASVDTSDAPSLAIWWTRQCLHWSGASRRGLITPHARAWLDAELEEAPIVFDEGFRGDPYFHPAFCGVSPLRLMR